MPPRVPIRQPSRPPRRRSTPPQRPPRAIPIPPRARPRWPPARQQVEAGGVELPSRDDFNTGGENADEFDPCAYGTALSDLLGQILAALEETGIDALAAVYPLLSFNSEPVGTGPFMCEPGCLAPGESLTLIAYEGYYDGAPATQTVVMPIITDDIQGANAVQAGQVDWKYSLTADAYDALERRSEHQVRGVPGLRLLRAPVQPARGPALR